LSESKSAYVLITPVRNEAAYVGNTIKSVVAQTRRPAEWVIVSDGSTDATNDIVTAAAAQHPWIRLLALPPRVGHSFAAVVQNTEKGIRSLQTTDYQFLGLLDADVTFPAGYFEDLIRHFDENSKLGLAGGVVIDVGLPKDRFPRNRYDVPGAVQFFRRACFESLGGMLAIPEGGWDALTCARARMQGYETRLLTSLVVDHHKPRNAAEGNVFRRKWQLGVRDYALGYHPLFELFKCVGRWYDRPYFIAAFCWWLGFCHSYLKRRPTLIPPDLLAFMHGEQKRRLWRLIGFSR
jgi:poly-beta-1,6-N-acetyl-D-glucosamine synthase